MNKPILSLLAASLLISVSTFAQKEKKEVKKEEKKEIVIEEKTKDKNEKMVIVIDGDKITINGKPADEYKGKKHIVIDDDIVINGNNVRVPGQGRMYFRGLDGSNRAMLGVVTEKSDKNGALVKDVKKESAAEKAGLKAGDVITRINDTEIKNQEDLVKTIGKLKPEDVADVAFLRDGKEKKVKATLDKSDAPMAMAWNMDSDHFNFNIDPPVAMTTPRGPREFRFNDNDMWMFRSDRPKYGMSIETNPDGDGVKVTGVEAESNAMKAGIKENDIITEVEGKTISGVDELRNVLSDAKDKSSISVKVLRNGSPENITIRVPKVIKKADL